MVDLLTVGIVIAACIIMVVVACLMFVFFFGLLKERTLAGLVTVVSMIILVAFSIAYLMV